jgi:hypothetical protein
MVDAADVAGGSPGVSVNVPLCRDALNRLGGVIEGLNHAKARLSDAMKSPEHGAFGRSKPAMLVVQYWMESLSQRHKETDECMEASGALYADFQECVENYVETDHQSRDDILKNVDDPNITPRAVDQIFDTYDKNPSQITPNRYDHGAIDQRIIAQLEGSPNSSDGSGNPPGTAAIEGGADEEE